MQQGRVYTIDKENVYDIIRKVFFEMKGGDKMSQRISIRRRQFKEKFFPLRKEGYTILEIAAQCDISRMTAYVEVRAIAKEHGMDYKDLLESPNKSHRAGRTRLSARPFIGEDFCEKAEQAKRRIEEMQQIVSNEIKEWEDEEES